MQQEVLSYAFPLGDDSTCSSISSHPNEMWFYSSVVNKANPHESILYRLKYNEENPRKSGLTSTAVKCRVNNIQQLVIDNETSRIFLNVSKSENQHQIKIIPTQELDKPNIEVDGLDTMHTSKDTIINIQKSKDQHFFLTTPREISLVDPNKPQMVESVIKVQQNSKISHSGVDPTKGFLTYCIGNMVYVYDKTSKSQKYSFKVSPHPEDTVANIDFNPNKQFYLMTTHHDYMKFWDIRKSNIPVKIVEEHHSLLMRAIYNHAHDELILGCYDDGAVGLYRMPTVSSSPSGEGTDALVKIYDEHQDSVYNACWSHSPWVFASISYSASNLVVNIVPNVQKYRILL